MISNPSQEQALQALRTKLSIQEEFAQSWAVYMRTVTVPENWLTKSSGAVNEVVPAVRKRVEASLRLFEQGSQVGLELLKLTIRAANADCLNTRLEGLQLIWEASLTEYRNGAHAMIEFHAKAVECWTQLINAWGRTK